MGIFDESERGTTEVTQARSRARTARPSWPLSARLLVGAMFIFNVLLAAFLVKTEIKRPEARPALPASSTPFPLEPPKAGSVPQLNAPPHAPVVQGASPDQGSSLGLKAPLVEVQPVRLPSTPRSKRPPGKAPPKALRASNTHRPVLSAPMPRVVISPPHEPLGQTPAAIRGPATSSGTSAHVAPPGLAASIPAARVPGSAGAPPNPPAASGLTPSAVLAPSALTPSAIARGLAARGTRSGSTTKVASVGLPNVAKGLVKPNMPVAPTSLKIEIIPRPAVKPENCGDDKVFIACPTLKIRYDTPYTSEDH